MTGNRVWAQTISRFCRGDTLWLLAQSVACQLSNACYLGWHENHPCFYRAHASSPWHPLSFTLKFHPSSQMSFATVHWGKLACYSFIHPFDHSFINKYLLRDCFVLSSRDQMDIPSRCSVSLLSLYNVVREADLNHNDLSNKYKATMWKLLWKKGTLCSQCL